MIDSYFRPKIQRNLIDSWLTKSFFKYIHPNVISILGCILGLIAAFLVYYQFVLTATFALLLSGLFDVLDGSIARAFKKKTDAGCAVDIIFDRIVESAIIFALFLVDIQQRAVISMFLMIGVLICITSFLVVGMFIKNTTEKSFHYSFGLCERTEAFIFFICMIVFKNAYFIAAYIFTALMLFTAFIRVIEFLIQNKNNSKLLPFDDSSQ